VKARAQAITEGQIPKNGRRFAPPYIFPFSFAYPGKEIFHISSTFLHPGGELQ
jgi:hypothetical protein